ncbi:MAG: permease prefix domain 1-containing protein [Oscillospiraceae bacterium]|nr:permease prefix domain 1-containing protein [Oscillospiraceae bacterium]
MTERIRLHIENLLRDAPRTRRIVDLQEELLSGCLDKFADLTAQGVSEEEAYNAVIAGIGDVDELIGKTRHSASDRNLLGPASSSLWPMITLIYLFCGFWLDCWHPAWLLFPIGAFLQVLLVAALAKPGERRGPLTGALYVGAAVIYLTFSVFTDQWAIGALIFMMAVVAQQITRLVRVWRDDR